MSKAILSIMRHNGQISLRHCSLEMCIQKSHDHRGRPLFESQCNEDFPFLYGKATNEPQHSCVPKVSVPVQWGISLSQGLTTE